MRRHGLNFLGDLRFGRVDVFQPEGEVLAHRHMRVERVGLEHHRQAAVGGGDCVDHLAFDLDIAGRDRLQPGNHPQKRGFSAAGRANEHAELAIRDLHVDAADYLYIAIGLFQVLEFNAGHFSPPTGLPGLCSSFYQVVMAGLDPAIHPKCFPSCWRLPIELDGRVKPGHDDDAAG
jgi:hypothetical protein